jgi:hypothetical protein
MKAILVVLTLVLLAGSGASAQDSSGSVEAAIRMDTGTSITIHTDVDSALIFLDSLRIGRSPLTVQDLEPGIHWVKVVHPDVTNWLTESIFDTIHVKAGEERILRYAFGLRHLLLSVPSGVDVIIGDSVSGTTPFILALSSRDSTPSIRLWKQGYDTATVTLSSGMRGMATTTLKKVWDPGLEEGSVDGSSMQEGRGLLRLYVTGAAAVLAGAAAAYFKIKADEKNGQYLENPTPSLRSEMRRLDTASAVCLTATQIGFGLLTYFLLTE